MPTELRVIFPLEISLVSGVGGQAGTGRWTGRDRAGSARVFIQVHHTLGKPAQALPPKALALFPLLTVGPFPAVPRSQDTDVLGHFVLSPQLSSSISSTTPTTSTGPHPL